MHHKILGQTGLKVPVIGQGTGLSGHGKSKVSYAALPKIIRQGIELGMNFVDTASVYGDGASEKAVGEAVKGMRERAFIATKVPPGEVSCEGVIRSAEASLDRLGIESIDLYQVHWSNPDIPLTETMSGMAKLIEAGKIRFIGVSNFSLRELEEAQAVLPDKKIVSVQLEYNLFDRTAEEHLLPYCEQNGLTAIAYSPLHRGRLTSGPKRLATLKEIGEKYGKTAAQVTLRWLVQSDSVIAIPNTTNARRLKENAQSSDFDLSDEDIQRIRQACSVTPVPVPTQDIRVSSEYGRETYETLEEAKENKLNFVPSPAQLAKQISGGEFLKPVRLVPSRDVSGGHQYDLTEGRIRFWAWVIAHDGKEAIPALIDEATA